MTNSSAVASRRVRCGMARRSRRRPGSEAPTLSARATGRRLGLAEGEPKYADLEKRLAQSPVIGVPTITMEGDANGAPHPAPAAYAKKFSGSYEHRHITGGIGHNMPQEAPQAFAQAVVDIAAS
jgi:pimeloyl-ACP methyl ester carboxylesterase